MIKFILLALLGVACAIEYRSYDGSGNNVNNPTWGTNGSPFQHPFNTTFYADSISEPRGQGYHIQPPLLPPERFIRNTVIRGQGPPDPAPSSDWAWVVGEYLAFETVRTIGNASEPWNIPIDNATDAYYYAQHNGSISFARCNFVGTTGTAPSNPRIQTNGATPYIDAQTVYGENVATAAYLRNGTGGLLKWQPGPDGELPTFYGDPTQLPAGVTPANNANNVPTAQLFALGSPRVNQQPQSMCLNILWRREHNRLARSLAQQNPTWNDETLYQEARRRVIAYMQHFYETEYMPMLLGIPNLDTYAGYDTSVNVDVNQMYNTVSLRYGHTQVNNITWRLNNDGSHATGGDILLRDVFFDPTIVVTYGCSDIWRGLGAKAHNSPEVNIVVDLQEFVFAKKGFVGIDLLSTNMRRARDMGLPALNDARALYGLPAWSSFNFTEWQPDLINAYGSDDPSLCDPWICALLEPGPSFVNGGELGELNYAVVKTQFQEFRDGDRFWYLNNQFSTSDLADIQGTKLSHIILRNSNLQSMKCDLFEVPGNPYTGTVGPTCYAPTSATSTTKSSSTRIAYSVAVVLMMLVAMLAL
jgi:hypothetical protein